MKKIVQKVFLFLLLLLPFGASAENTISIKLPVGTSQFLSNLSNHPYLAFNNIFNFIFSLGFGIAVLGLIANGIRYIAGFGNEEQIEKAKNGVYYSILGLIILLLAFTIATTINYIFAPA